MSSREANRPRLEAKLLLLLTSAAMACSSEAPSAPAQSDGGGGSTAVGAPSPDGGTSTEPKPTSGEGSGFKYAFTPSAVAISCKEDAAALRASGAAQVSFGAATIVAGYEQIDANDQDPIVARLEGDRVLFCEHTKSGGGPDGRAYGVTWDGKDTLYGVFTIVGGGTAFDAAAKQGWIPAYGDGGGSAKVMVVGKLDAATGKLERATYVPARLTKNGQTKTNTLTPADAVHVLADGNLEVRGSSAFCSLNPDRSSMCAEGGSDYPKDYVARLSPDLSRMVCASANGVSRVAQPCR